MKTKNFKAVMDNLKVEKGLVVLAENDKNVVLCVSRSWFNEIF